MAATEDSATARSSAMACIAASLSACEGHHDGTDGLPSHTELHTELQSHAAAVSGATGQIYGDMLKYL